jgi:hypothetical protein
MNTNIESNPDASVGAPTLMSKLIRIFALLGITGLVVLVGCLVDPDEFHRHPERRIIFSPGFQSASEYVDTLDSGSIRLTMIGAGTISQGSAGRDLRVSLRFSLERLTGGQTLQFDAARVNVIYEGTPVALDTVSYSDVTSGRCIARTWHSLRPIPLAASTASSVQSTRQLKVQLKEAISLGGRSIETEDVIAWLP